jgi:serine/threonine protein kinase
MDLDHVLGGRYVVSGQLGRGGMAEVHLAHDLRLDRQVAVKVLRPDIALDPTYLARFRREALSAASLNHPAVVAVFDSGEDTEAGKLLPYLVMEYVRGPTLAELLRDGTPRPAAEALRLTRSVLEALAHAHAHGIVHRDIKPANVMLDEYGLVKVMDFGIARPMNTAGATLTQSAMVIGTAEYLSPEQAKGLTVDARADLYSTGVLLYELLTGRPPFVGDTPLQVAWQHLQATPEPPSVHVPELTGACDRLVLRALEKDREERFGSAAEMRAALDEALRSLEQAPAPASASAPASAAAATPTPTAVDDGTPTGRRRRKSRPKQAASAQRAGQPRSARSRIAAAAATGVVLVGVVGALLAFEPSAAHRVDVTPDLTGLTLAQARVSAHRAGLAVDGVRMGGCSTFSVQLRHVCGQAPSAGSVLTAGEGITLRLLPAVDAGGSTSG